MVEKKRVAIVGAGASGLTTARHALLYDVEPVIFEESQHFGGLWRFKPYETTESSVMKSTVINTSKEMTAFSDFPPPADFANFMHNRKMLEYLELYIQHFGIEKFIRYGCSVKNIQRSENYKQNGKWIVEYKNGDESNQFEEFDGVLLCNGHHAKPFYPEEWIGQNKFLGRISHAHSYKDSRGFDDQIVAVVGVGNSGIDIAVELSRISKQVYLVTRRGTWIFHRNLDYSIPFDLPLNSRLLELLKSIFPDYFSARFLQFLIEKRLDHEKFGLKPKHGVLSAHITVNDELPNRLSCGTIIVKPNIREFTENGLIFEDDSQVEPVHQVILSTGYSFEFPLVENGNLIPVIENDVSLYLNMFPIPTSDHNTLAVIGLIQPLGSIIPISEMQARLYFSVLMGETELPNENVMQEDIKIKKEKMFKRYVQTRRHTIQVDYVSYMDELASMLGCKPNPFSYLLTDPLLAYRLLCGPNAPYVYRIGGPHPWDGARDALINLNDRVLNGMRGGSTKIKDLKNCQENFSPTSFQNNDNEKSQFLKTNAAKLLILFFLLILLILSFAKWF